MLILRCVLGGLAVAVISQIFAMIVFIGFFESYFDATTAIWRPMDSPYWTYGLPLADLLSGLLVSVGFLLLHRGVPGTGLRKGLNYGLIVGLICRVPGEAFYYVMLPIPFMLTIGGLLHGLLTMSVGGVALAAMYGKRLES